MILKESDCMSQITLKESNYGPSRMIWSKNGSCGRYRWLHPKLLKASNDSLLAFSAVVHQNPAKKVGPNKRFSAVRL